MGIEKERIRIVNDSLMTAILNGHEERIQKLEEDVKNLEHTLRIVIKRKKK